MAHERRGVVLYSQERIPLLGINDLGGVDNPDDIIVCIICHWLSNLSTRVS
jgi:hypothetical protein